MRISVIGSGVVDTDTTDRAEQVGRAIGERGHDLVCGGRGGVMAAACRGAVDAGGLTIGILPGEQLHEANPHVQVPIVTGLGNARNVLVVLNGDGVIAIDGAYGTLSEIAHALDAGRPVAGLDTHDIDGVEAVNAAVDAVAYLEGAVSLGE